MGLLNLFGGGDKKTSNSTSITDSYNTQTDYSYVFDSSGQNTDYGSPSLSLNLASGAGATATGATSGGQPGLFSTLASGNVVSYLPWIIAGVVAIAALFIWKGKGR